MLLPVERGTAHGAVMPCCRPAGLADCATNGSSGAGAAAGCSRGSTRLPDAADPSNRRRDCSSANTVKGSGRHRCVTASPRFEAGADVGNYPGPLGEASSTHTALYASPTCRYAAGQSARELSLSRKRKARPCGHSIEIADMIRAARPAYKVAHAGQFSLGSSGSCRRPSTAARQAHAAEGGSGTTAAVALR